MYGMCTGRFNLCFFPYASRKIICNSWIGCAQEIKTDVVIVGDFNGDNCVVPYTKTKSLPMTTDKTDKIDKSIAANDDKVLDWSPYKRKDNGDGNNDDILENLKVEMHNSLISLPIIYMSRSHLQLNRSATFLNVSNEQPKLLQSETLLKASDSPSDKDKKKPEAEVEKEVDKLAKTVKDTKENVKLDSAGAKGKLGKLDKVGSSIFPKKKQKKSKAAKKSKSAGMGGFSWAAIEKKLPAWQNTIADTLQKLQDLVFKHR